MQSHAPFTFLGAVSGIAILVVFLISGASPAIAARVFWSLHPLHVLLSALVTSALFTRHSRPGWMAVLAVGYLGSVGIATVWIPCCTSDIVFPLLLVRGERGGSPQVGAQRLPSRELCDQDLVKRNPGEATDDPPVESGGSVPSAGDVAGSDHSRGG